MGACFVDSKKRHLRLSAFAVANKCCQQAPWTSIAVIKKGLIEGCLFQAENKNQPLCLPKHITRTKLTREECMELMLEVLSDPGLHARASEGYKKTGQSIDLHGKEDGLICREAATFWNDETTDGFVNMRPRVDVELAAVADEIRSGGLTWCQRDVLRLITPYPAQYSECSQCS